MAKGKVKKGAKPNKTETATTKTAKDKGSKDKAVKVNNLGVIYQDKFVTAEIVKDELLICCKLNATISGSGKSMTLVSLGGIKNAKCEQISEAFGALGGYFTVLCGYTKGVKE